MSKQTTKKQMNDALASLMAGMAAVMAEDPKLTSSQAGQIFLDRQRKAESEKAK